MKKRALLLAALLTISTLSTGKTYATEVSSWSELETNKGAANIEFSNDITADGDTSPMPITFTSDADQTINGNYHSFSSNDLHSDRWYYYSLSVSKPAGSSLSLINLGKASNGSAADNTFSYVDLDGNTVYKNIEASVNNWKGYFLTINKPITVNITNSVFTDNGKDTDAKLIYVSGSGVGTVNITDSIFYNNRVANVEGVVSGGSYNLNIENSIFYNNRNTTSDAGVLSSSGKVTIKDSYFINNSSADCGGVATFRGGEGTTIDGSKFEGNTARIDGGAFYMYSNAQFDYIKNSEFKNNSNQYSDGGAISTGGGYIKSIEDTIFEGNIAYSRGGGIWYGIAGGYGEKEPILFNNVTFKNNEAGTAGALFTEGDRKNATYIVNSEFTDNIAKEDGHDLWYSIPIGGAMLALGVPVTVINTTFNGNNAIATDSGYSAGGAIYFAGEGSEYPFTIVDSSFSGSSATKGGAIYIQDADTLIAAASKDVVFSGNTALADADDYNGGADIYFDTTSYSSVLSLNAAEDKKITFNGSVAVAEGDNTAIMDINKDGLTYNTYDGTTETPVDAGTSGEIQFNARVGDEDNNFSRINLWGGTLSIGKDSTATNPDGLINDNNFYVMGDSTLSTVNGVIGEFAPSAFEIADDVSLDYMFDVDLAGGVSDTIGVTANNGSINLSSFNVISDSDTEGLRIKYSDTNVGGVVKDGYSITTSSNTYDVTAENGDDGSYVVFSMTEGGGGLAAAIKNESDQYIITNGEDENVTSWSGSDGNVIKSDIDINGNGNSIYTENGLDGMVVSEDTNVIIRNVEELSGFDNALTNDGGTLSIVDSNITGNTGDADIINEDGTVNINASTKDVTIGSEDTDYALLSDGGTINVKGSNSVTFNGDISGDDTQMNISTDTTFNGEVSDMNIAQTSGTVNVNDDLTSGDYTLDGGTLNVNEEGSFSPDEFMLNNGTVNISDESAFSPEVNTFNGGNINAANGSMGDLNFNDLTLNGTTNLAVDVDMNNGVMDTISASSVNGDGKINVNQFNLTSETNNPNIIIDFADETIRDHVGTDISSIEGKIFKYNVGYNPETGQFNFAGGGRNSKGYSPSVMASPVAAQMQGYLTQLNSYDEAFRNMDMYMLLPYRVRQAMKYRNKVAINSSDTVYDADKTIYDDNTGWVRTHTTFEKVPLKNGPKVSNVAYGIYLGGESELYDLGKGWEGMWGLYAGYNGSHQSYNGISMYQNGGTLGVLGMAYKGNFFQGLTINTGANAGDAHTKFGHEDFSMLMAGVASKTGYNIELKQGKFIIQPSLLLSYSFVNSFDYTNSAGVRISSDPLHAIQVEPNLKFIANLKNGWQPYANVGMVWNIMDKTHYMANDVSLPELSVKPYVKYGVGIRKTWGERFTGFFQTFLTHGGRNGVGIQIGFRWSLGGKKSETKVLSKPTNISNKKVIKRLENS